MVSFVLFSFPLSGQDRGPSSTPSHPRSMVTGSTTGHSSLGARRGMSSVDSSVTTRRSVHRDTDPVGSVEGVFFHRSPHLHRVLPRGTGGEEPPGRSDGWGAAGLGLPTTTGGLAPRPPAARTRPRELLPRRHSFGSPVTSRTPSP